MAGTLRGIASIKYRCDGRWLQRRPRNKEEPWERTLSSLWRETESQAGGHRAGRRIRLDHPRTIRQERRLVEHVVGEMSTKLRHEPLQQRLFDIDGVEPEFNKMRTVPVEAGRFISARTTRRVRARARHEGERAAFGKRQNIIRIQHCHQFAPRSR